MLGIVLGPGTVAREQEPQSPALRACGSRLRPNFSQGHSLNEAGTGRVPVPWVRPEVPVLRKSLKEALQCEEEE